MKSIDKKLDKIYKVVKKLKKKNKKRKTRAKRKQTTLEDYAKLQLLSQAQSNMSGIRPMAGANSGNTPLDLSRLKEEVKDIKQKQATKESDRTKDAVDLYKQQLLLEHKQNENPRQIIERKNNNNDDMEDGQLYEIKNRMDYLISFVDTLKKQARLARNNGLDEEVKRIEQQKDDVEKQVDELTQKKGEVKKNYYRINQLKKQEQEQIRQEKEAEQKRKEQEQYEIEQQMKQIEIDKQKIELQAQQYELEQRRRKEEAKIQKQLETQLKRAKSGKAIQEVVNIADEKQEEMNNTLQGTENRDKRHTQRKIEKLLANVKETLPF